MCCDVVNDESQAPQSVNMKGKVANGKKKPSNLGRRRSQHPMKGGWRLR